VRQAFGPEDDMRNKNFSTALYFTVYDIERIDDLAVFAEVFSFFEKHVRLDKAYLETCRSGRLVAEEKIRALKGFFEKLGIATAGGITPSARSDQEWEFRSFCYTDPAQLDFLTTTVAYTARLFDEIIIDDFFFDNCCCERCRTAKNGRSWTDFRLALLSDAAVRVFLAPAREANPRVRLIIKFPNWYEHYQGTGYNLEAERDLFDGVYAGTESRDPVRTQQSLPRYLSYFIMRYLTNAAPGKIGGGWFDTYDCSYNPNSYIEQALLTLYAKPKEVTLFCAGLMLHDDRLFTPLAGFAFERADRFLEQLGKPVGIHAYKPFHSRGEDYLHGRLGMLGLPLEPSPVFDAQADPILLTGSAGQDERIVERIEGALHDGRTVIVTSGLVKALTGRGFSNIAEIGVTDRKTAVREFGFGLFACSYGGYCAAPEPILMPEISLYTNNSWPVIAGFSDGRGIPFLVETRCDRGRLFVLAVPDDFSALSKLPREVLDALRRKLLEKMPVVLAAPADVALFLYDNATFIVHSFLPFHQTVAALVAGRGKSLVDLETGEILRGREESGRTAIDIRLRASQMRVFAVKSDPVEDG
jgi:hypothetical protein